MARWAVVLVLVVVGACGRLHFDPRDDGGTTDDAAALACLPDHQRLTTEAASSWDPAVAYANGNYAVVWQDFRSSWDVYFELIGPDGEVLVDELYLDDGTGPRIAWNGERFAVVFSGVFNSVPGMGLVLLDANGTIVAGPTAIVTSVSLPYPQIVGVPGGFGLAWTTNVSEVRFVPFDNTGTKLGPDITYANCSPANCDRVGLAATADGFAFVWADTGTGMMEMVLVDGLGARLSGDIVITDGAQPALADLPSGGFALTWRASTMETYVARLDAAGVIVTTPTNTGTLFNTSTSPVSVIATSTELAAARAGVLARFDYTGALLGSTGLGMAVAYTSRPVATPDGYVLAYTDMSGGDNGEIYITQVCVP